MPDESGSSVRLAGSERGSLPDVTDTAPLNTQERAEVTLVLRRRAELPEEIVAGPTVLSRDELAERYGADPADVDLVSRELGRRGLAVTAVHAVTRRVKVAGTLGDLSSAFGTTLRQVSSPDPRGRGRVTHRYREGPLFLPAALDGVVTAVLGLDTRPQAQPHFRTRGDDSGRRPPRAPRTRRTRWRTSTTSRPVPPAPGRRSRSSSWAAGSRPTTLTPTSPAWALRCRPSPRPAWTGRPTTPGTPAGPPWRSTWTST